jgi:hypothetical protein
MTKFAIEIHQKSMVAGALPWTPAGGSPRPQTLVGFCWDPGGVIEKVGNPWYSLINVMLCCFFCNIDIFRLIKICGFCFHYNILLDSITIAFQTHLFVFSYKYKLFFCCHCILLFSLFMCCPQANKV